jgi:flagellar biosynthesis/type III secretory pathway protein FliH
MRIDEINAMADADIRENEQLEKLAESVYGKGVKEDYEEGFVDGYNKAKETLYTKQDMIDLVESLKDYTKESHTILGHDDRDAIEFVDIFLDYSNYKDNE